MFNRSITENGCILDAFENNLPLKIGLCDLRTATAKQLHVVVRMSMNAFKRIHCPLNSGNQFLWGFLKGQWFCPKA